MTVPGFSNASDCAAPRAATSLSLLTARPRLPARHPPVTSRRSVTSASPATSVRPSATAGFRSGDTAFPACPAPRCGRASISRQPPHKSHQSHPVLCCAAALQALKRKKRYEKQLAQIDGTLSTIEFQREALENANTNTEVLKNMGFAAKAMKAAHDNMDIDKVDELMQDIAEQQELADEISTAISKPVGFGEEFDEDELMAELEELEQEELDKNLLEISGPETVPLPNVPSISIPSKPAKKKEEEEDDDMKELEAWAGTM
ncbi:PREDICTED: charged multivesicular body protein 4b [Ficedula albicollis]|uniref:charged multivesicular body protein 4b n=1 Tax=Ficedula albicollis TaxID=59894 RepID=UPI000359458F|nr:PREDICTED: charged multivesicular body protein 4b [Ficedula albicollis]